MKWLAWPMGAVTVGVWILFFKALDLKMDGSAIIIALAGFWLARETQKVARGY